MSLSTPYTGGLLEDVMIQNQCNISRKKMEIIESAILKNRGRKHSLPNTKSSLSQIFCLSIAVVYYMPRSRLLHIIGPHRGHSQNRLAVQPVRQRYRVPGTRHIQGFGERHRVSTRINLVHGTGAAFSRRRRICGILAKRERGSGTVSEREDPDERSFWSRPK